MNAEQLKKLKKLALTVKYGRSELKPAEYKQIELSEFHAEASPEVVLALIEELADACDSVDFYKRRVDLLQQWQSKMRDPERTIACDIIANGQTLPPEHAGNRYSIPEDQTAGEKKIAQPDAVDEQGVMADWVVPRSS